MITVIQIFFKLLNFSVLLSLFLYLMKTSIIPAVVKMIADYSVYVKTLQDDYQNLQIDCQRIAQQTKDHEQRLVAMKNKFAIWQEKCKAHKALQKADQKIVEKQMQQRFAIRSKIVENQLLKQDQLPGILDRAAQNLYEKYHATDMQKKYIEELVCEMKEFS